MTTGFAGPYDLVAAIVMAILAACMGISIHPAVAGVVLRRGPGSGRDPERSRLPVPDPDLHGAAEDGRNARGR